MGRAGRSFGPTLSPSGTTFRLWAPAAESVDVIIDGNSFEMTRASNGWFATTIASAGAGTRYRFRIDGEFDVPDPASQYQPEDVAGPSEVIDHSAFSWRAEQWRGRPWQDAVFLECHVGTFSPEGTFRGLIDRLDHIVETGITAIELMPVATFPGDLPRDAQAFLDGRETFTGTAHGEGDGADFRFLRFRPPALAQASSEQPLPYIRMDRALQFLLGDRLA